MSVKTNVCQGRQCAKGKRDRFPETAVPMEGSSGDPGPGTTGPRNEAALRSYSPGKRPREHGEEAAAREAPRRGCGQPLTDGWGARGVVHSNKETSGKLTL